MRVNLIKNGAPSRFQTHARLYSLIYLMLCARVSFSCHLYTLYRNSIEISYFFYYKKFLFDIGDKRKKHWNKITTLSVSISNKHTVNYQRDLFVATKKCTHWFLVKYSTRKTTNWKILSILHRTPFRSIRSIRETWNATCRLRFFFIKIPEMSSPVLSLRYTLQCIHSL